MLRSLLQGGGQGSPRSSWRRGGGRIFYRAGGLLRIPAFKGLAVLFTGQVAHQTFDHGGGIGIPFGQIDQRAAQNDFAPRIQLARLRRFPVLQREEPGLGLGIALLGAV